MITTRIQIESYLAEYVRGKYYDETVGTVLALERYSGEQLEWIIKTACVFILEGDNYLEYEFNEDYTAVVHRYIPPDVKEWILSRCKHRV